VLGTWVVDGHAAGLGVRESSNLIAKPTPGWCRIRI
jgi:glutathionylspermidine synthase